MIYLPSAEVRKVAERRPPQKDSTFHPEGTRHIGDLKGDCRRMVEQWQYRKQRCSELFRPSVSAASNPASTVSRLTGKLDPGVEPPRVQMHRFDPLPLISSRPLLITLPSEDYLARSSPWLSGQPRKNPSGPGLTTDLQRLLPSGTSLAISLRESLAPG